jgi:hypothetical protein
MATNGSVLGYINAPPLNPTVDDPSNAPLSTLEYVESALLALNPFTWLIPDSSLPSVVSDVEDVNEAGADIASGGVDLQPWAIGFAVIAVLVLIVLLLHEVELL